MWHLNYGARFGRRGGNQPILLRLKLFFPNKPEIQPGQILQLKRISLVKFGKRKKLLLVEQKKEGTQKFPFQYR
jgi:hypothetical protein